MQNSLHQMIPIEMVYFPPSKKNSNLGNIDFRLYLASINFEFLEINN